MLEKVPIVERIANKTLLQPLAEHQRKVAVISDRFCSSAIRVAFIMCVKQEIKRSDLCCAGKTGDGAVSVWLISVQLAAKPGCSQSLRKYQFRYIVLC